MSAFTLHKLNLNDVLLYEKKMEALIRGWRETWRLGDFPFCYVQIAPYNYGVEPDPAKTDTPDFSRLPLLWEAQRKALRIPNTGMAVIRDVTNLTDIHPQNKREVGFRLALWARARTYGETRLVPSGPLYRAVAFENGKARISLDHAGSGLVALDGRPLTWFEIAGADRTFVKAFAEIQGSDVLVWNPRVARPEAVTGERGRPGGNGTWSSARMSTSAWRIAASRNWTCALCLKPRRGTGRTSRLDGG